MHCLYCFHCYSWTIDTNLDKNPLEICMEWLMKTGGKMIFYLVNYITRIYVESFFPVFFSCHVCWEISLFSFGMPPYSFHSIASRENQNNPNKTVKNEEWRVIYVNISYIKNHYFHYQITDLSKALYKLRNLDHFC